MFAPSVVFVDLETTGANPASERITEVGIVKVTRGELEYEWSSLVNPLRPIPPLIQGFTGITDAMVREAPRFADLAGEIAARLAGSLFVAHNARFDLAFLRNEFRRLDMEFRPQVLCTVKLSRALYPGEHRHGLDRVMARHGIVCTARHRALGDARVLWEFARIVAREHDAATLAQAVARAMKQGELPAGLAGQAADDLSDEAGVFVLRGDADAALYVGRGPNMRAAVLAHLGGRGARLAPAVRRIECRATAGELGSRLLELELLRRLRPAHNRRPASADDMLALLRREAPAGEPAVLLRRLAELDVRSADALHGPFRRRSEAANSLRGLAGAYGLCLKRLGLETGAGACSAQPAGACRGVCVGQEAPVAHDLRLDAALARLRIKPWPYAGPVALRESAPDSETAVLHVFDRWCHLGSVGDEAELAELLARPPASGFDAEVYRLLLRSLAGAALIRLPAPGAPRA